jgi:hypothetical protein
LGPESWLLFNKLGFSNEELEWLLLDPKVWDQMSGYQKFRDFVKRVTLVNDPAERGVGLIKQFITSFKMKTPVRTICWQCLNTESWCLKTVKNKC